MKPANPSKVIIVPGPPVKGHSSEEVETNPAPVTEETAPEQTEATPEPQPEAVASAPEA